MSYTDLISLEGSHNTRDLGGYVGLGGRKVRRSLLFRSDSLSQITPNDCRILSEDLHLGYCVDLRSDSESSKSPDVQIPGCSMVRIPITSKILQGSTIQAPEYLQSDPDISWHYRRLFSLDSHGDAIEGMKNLYLHYVEMETNQRAFSELLNLIAESDRPLLFHCADGKDRTGMAAAYILYILGVDRETILRDYEASADNLSVKVKARERRLREFGITDEYLIENLCLLASVKRCWMESALDRIDQRYGGMDRYLKEVLKVSEDEKEKIRSKYLEN